MTVSPTSSTISQDPLCMAAPVNIELSKSSNVFDVSTTKDLIFNTTFTTTNDGISRSASGAGKTSKKPYKCTFCNKSFAKPSALQPHIYTHTGEKPFECHIAGCNKRFAVISNLRRHFKVHAPKKVVTKNRMSHKERIMRVRQLANIAQNNQQKDDIMMMPFLHPYSTILDISASSSTSSSSFPSPSSSSTTTITTTSSTSTSVMNDHHTTHTTAAPTLPCKQLLCDEINCTTGAPEPIIYINPDMAAAASVIDPQPGTDLCIQPSTFAFSECGNVTSDYLSFDTPVVGPIASPIDPMPQWIQLHFIEA